MSVRRACLTIAALATLNCASQQRREQPPQAAQLNRAIAAPSRLQPVEPLPAVARQLLATRMVSHGHDMGDLVSAIMILDYDRIRARARGIAGDVDFARPLTHDATELNAALPAKFFLYQDALRTQTALLADAAARQSAFDVAKAYGAVSETCVQCHATYRGR